MTELAAEYVAGTLSDETAQRFEARLREDADARRVVGTWKVEIDAFVGAIASAALSDNDKPWVEIAPGITGKALRYDHQVGSMVYVVRLQPGVRCPVAASGSPEECLLISGDLSLGGVSLKAGDRHHAANSVIHGGGHSDRGAVLFIRARDA